MSLEDVEKRRQVAENRKKETEAKKLAQKEKKDNRYFLQVSKDLMQLGPDLIYGPKPLLPSKNTKNSGSSTRNKKREDQPLVNAFQDLLRIGPDVFEELVSEDLVLNTPIRNKEKGIPRRKNTTGSVQVGLGMVEEEREEKVSEVRISTRGCIIRTHKM